MLVIFNFLSEKLPVNVEIKISLRANFGSLFKCFMALDLQSFQGNALDRLVAKSAPISPAVRGNKLQSLHVVPLVDKLHLQVTQGRVKIFGPWHQEGHNFLC